MFIAYKLVQLLLKPAVWLLVLLVTAAVLGRRARSADLARAARLTTWARRSVGLALALFVVLGTRPLSAALVAPLERSSLPLAMAPADVDAVVVLAAGAHRRPGDGKATILGTRSLDRLVEGIRLHRTAAGKPLVLSGGVGDPLGGTPPEAEAMRAMALDLGVAVDTVLVDGTSRTTSESALAVRRALPDARAIVLVTSALHLPRAAALFRHQGFVVTAAPADFAINDNGWTFGDFVPSFSGMDRSSRALHEVVGYAVYRLAGRL